MGLRDFMYTEKGRITSSVVAAVLVTTVVLVPLTIVLDRNIRGGTSQGNENVKSFGYDDNVTSTGLRQDNWMGITPTTMIDASGSEVTSMEATLSKNDSYTGVITDEELIAGVNSTNGIAYLSNSHVSKDSNLKPLNISEDGGETWINVGDADYIAAPLNMVMKVPQAVSVVLKDYISPTATEALTIEDLNGLQNSVIVDTSSESVESTTVLDTYDYGDWLVSEGYTKDFALSVIAFNWIAQAQPAFDKVDTEYAHINEAGFANGEEFFNWANIVFGGDQTDTWGVINESGDGWAFTSEEILIDGTGTNDPAVNLALEAFEEEYGVSITANLNNGGSYRGWETSEADVAGVVHNEDEYDGSEDGAQGAFIGTQSRGMETASMTGKSDISGEISYWGYDESVYDSGTFGNVSSSDKENIIYDFSAFVDNDEVPLATTIAGDQIVFFTTVDANFEYEGETYAPTGVSQEGAKMLFQLGATWEEVYSMGFLQAERV